MRLHRQDHRIPLCRIPLVAFPGADSAGIARFLSSWYWEPNQPRDSRLSTQVCCTDDRASPSATQAGLQWITQTFPSNQACEIVGDQYQAYGQCWCSLKTKPVKSEHKSPPHTAVDPDTSSPDSDLGKETVRILPYLGFTELLWF